MNQTEKHFLQLLYYGMHHVTDQKEQILAMNLAQVYQLSRNAGLSAFLDWVLEKNQVRKASFQASRDNAIRHQILLQKAEEMLTLFLDKK